MPSGCRGISAVESGVLHRVLPRFGSCQFTVEFRSRFVFSLLSSFPPRTLFPSSSSSPTSSTALRHHERLCLAALRVVLRQSQAHRTKGPSPPRTPVDHLKPRSSSSTPSDDSSIIDDLSFEYVFDDEGNYVRLSKGGSAKSNHSTPPTPADVCHATQTPHVSAAPFKDVIDSVPLGAEANPVYCCKIKNHKQKTVRGLHIHNDDEPRLKQEEKENRLDPSEDPYVLAIAAASARRNSPPLATRSTSLSGMQSRGAGLSRLLPTTRPLADRASDFQILPGPNRPGRILKGLGSAAAKFSTASGFGRISETETSVNDSGTVNKTHIPMTIQTSVIVDDRANGLGPPPVSAPPGFSNNPLSHRQRSHGAIGGTAAPAIEKATNNRPEALEDNPYNFHQINYQQEQLPHVRPGSSLGLIRQSTSRAQGPDNCRPAGDDREPEPSDQQSQYPFVLVLCQCLTPPTEYLREEKRMVVSPLYFFVLFNSK
ncbi:Dual-specificity kinase, spindle pole body (SPB) duplication and spindle checkpoint function [Salix suchowensis]|nr:Dual-specificity kinase, spindle pole body (SPB) duplication and spindle checkpoint function [Salix suchowensis]